MRRRQFRKKVYHQEFSLDGSGIDGFSEVLEEHLSRLEVERQNRIRIRFSLEESLLRLSDRFGEDGTFLLKIESRFGRTQIQIEKEGDIYNPLSKTEAGLEDWSGSLLTAVGLSPLYSYSGGKNILRLSIPQKRMNAAVKLLIAMGIGILAGTVIHQFVPEGVQTFLSEEFLNPLYEFWIRLLTVCSGPVVFLMVCSSVLNSGTIEEEGGSTRRIVIRYFLLSLLFALIAVLVAAVFLPKSILDIGLPELNGLTFLKEVLKIMPSDVITPLMQSNTPQILLIAFVIGYGILYLGSGNEMLKAVVHQGNMLGLLITAGISRLVPYFAGILICMEIVEGRIQTFGGIWQILCLSLIVSFCALCVAITYVAGKKKTPVRLLIRKVWPAFASVIKTGGIDEGFGRMERDCVRRLGIEKHFTSVSLPHGLVLYMPVNVIGTLLFTIYASAKYGVTITVGWLAIAIVLSVFLFVATPPVPGANLLAYIMIFAQLGVPSMALIDAMIFDIIFGIFASAGNQTLLQMELILQADRIGLLNREMLRKK